MIKPKHLQKGDKVAIVSLSNGLLGEPMFLHKYHIAKKRLEEDFGLSVVVMENTLKGIDYLYQHPEARAKDLMEAFADPSIRGIFCAIGGNDTIRLLPYIDFDVIKNNPKVFTGFSDTTSNHFMLYKAGLMSYYGASVMTNFAEYVKINDYTYQKIVDTLFEPKETLPIESADYWYDDEDEKIWWSEENMHRLKPYHKEDVGYEFIQGEGVVEGRLLGGCFDVFIDLIGTEIWPSVSEWSGKIMFIETSEEDMNETVFTGLLRNLAAQGILSVLKGIVVGKPARRSKYVVYNAALKKVLKEVHREDMPVLCNVNFGHAEPIGVIPYGVMARLDVNNRTFTLLESATS